ncbi:mRNA turnover protein-like protein 4 [Amniculicola lignicola CBS 123094]|uniref:Ribosome assembly factor mrt4 n=1 Tax=Amniculicola lignicola CBS 123094 TaxID=1392246 RepID=A0A6A5WDI5_9PLEO|nr:mRNA turnover protein-like protein 4 [Amniculicola lignicola CBS 123094]
MPKSRRAKIVHLSKTDKKGKELTLKLFANVQEAANTYTYIFVFSVENMRNSYLKTVRSEFSDSRLFFGKTKVMAKALGHDTASEVLTNVHKLAKYLNGNVGLFFTNRDPQSIIDYFQSFSESDFARAGIAATRTFTIPEGVVYSRGGELAAEDDVQMPHSLEVTVRKWGMPTRLVKGKVVLDADYTVCKEGQMLNSHQTALLKLFGVAMADFKIDMQAYYSSATEEVVEIGVMEE